MFIDLGFMFKSTKRENMLRMKNFTLPTPKSILNTPTPTVLIHIMKTVTNGAE